jgi:hypothetical protein
MTYTGTLIQDLEAAVDKVEKRPTMAIIFHLPPDDYDQVRSTAKEAGVSVSRFCRTAVSVFLRDMGE